MSATVTFYRFAPLARPESWRVRIERAAAARGLLGTVLLAPEGVNATLWGPAGAIDRLLSEVDSWRPFGGVRAIRSPGPETPPFRRLRVRVRAEIVTLRSPQAKPLQRSGRHLGPAEWKTVLADPGIPVVDVRNAYETRAGGFTGALTPNTTRFTEFKQWAETQLDPRRTPRVAMYCTGGIRCEKASSFLLEQGFEAVDQLDGGILRFLSGVPTRADPQEKAGWWGECFVFDERVSVGPGLTPGSMTLCRACRRPLGSDDRRSPAFVDGVACPHCHDAVSASRSRGFAERRRQVELARRRGGQHLRAQAPHMERDPQR